jgi:hypothetical protein
MYTLQGKTRSTWHICFPHQSTYARRTLSAGSPRMWQPFTSHRQSWAGPLLPRKGLLTQSTARGLTDPRVRTQFLSRANLEAVGAKPSICRRQDTRLIGPISPTHWSLTDTGGGGATAFKVLAFHIPLPDLPNRRSPLSTYGPRPVSSLTKNQTQDPRFKFKKIYGRHVVFQLLGHLP